MGRIKEGINEMVTEEELSSMKMLHPEPTLTQKQPNEETASPETGQRKDMPQRAETRLRLPQALGMVFGEIRDEGLALQALKMGFKPRCIARRTAATS